ncbi:MAG: DNA-binding response regulator [Gallionellales bacterium 35-53-114]|jgi:two-component system OmpR family response regulator/two-component system response regulator QseB|nr:MAG: DNA-binding response regulator [Gallionellales bacterium 35-53-114]OYZ62554.1 MAG: DNA-binding response regulator [Gallionellales bacterium 24-53-125]OZB09513.1 MAG: DNA-binding response regulator [Gallionellales bacterium 39-52-133]HQS57820.1 response regulator [Gallionellaceae bacterium]HQS74273.1 response regulator [Gallionellaceae bacterium]
MRILVVEDDALLGDAIQAGLKQGGYAVDWMKDGVTAEQALASEPYAAVVLDLGLPRLSGLELLQRLRRRNGQAGQHTPVLILTAMDTVEDRIKGLDAGADDYLAKPFDMGELGARLRALIRRSSGKAEPTLNIAGVILDPASHRVLLQGKPVELSSREFALLHALMLSAGKVLSRAQLEEQLYAWGEEIESNAVEVHIHHLRRKLFPELIATIRGVGYLIQRDKEA